MKTTLLLCVLSFATSATSAMGAQPQAVPAGAPPTVRPAPKVPPAQGPTYRMLTMPKVRVDPALVDFGDVRPGKQVSGEVRIFNESEVPIRIARTLSTCMCTVATPAQEEIAPGASTTLTITLDTNDLIGPVTRYIQVQFEGGARPLAIGARAYVSEGIRASIQYERPERDDLLLVDLVEPAGQAFRVLCISGAEPTYVDEALSADEPRAEHHLRVERALDDPRLWLAIETDHPEAPLVVIAVDSDAIGDMEERPTWIISEKRFVERGLAPGAPHELLVNLRGISADEQGDIKSVRVADDRVQVRVSGGEGDGPFALNLKLELTPRSDVKGLVHTLLEISARGFVQHVDLIMLVNGEPQDAPVPASEATGGAFEAPASAAQPEPAMPDPVPAESDEVEPDDDDDDGWAPITPPARSASRT